MARRSASGVTDLLSDIIDDIKDFIDDEVIDRGRDSERDLRRAGRNWTDSDDRERASRRGASGSRGDDLNRLREALRALNSKVDALAEDSGTDLPIAGYDQLTVAEINERLPGLSQAELGRIEDHERAHDKRTTVLGRIQALRGEQPWEGYDDQTVVEIRKQLTDADSDTAAGVKRYEAKHKNRQGVLDAADSAASSS